MKLETKLVLAFLAVGVIPFAVIGFTSVHKAGKALSEQAYGQPEGMRQVKKAQIEKFFAERRGDMGVLVETVGTLRKEAFDKLTAVREVKKAAVERYFQGINDQILTFSEDQMVIDAMKQCAASFRDMREQTLVSPKEMERMRSRLRAYYMEDFSGEYGNQNNGNSPDAAAYLSQLDQDSIVLHSVLGSDTPRLAAQDMR